MVLPREPRVGAPSAPVHCPAVRSSASLARFGLLVLGGATAVACASSPPLSTGAGAGTVLVDTGAGDVHVLVEERMVIDEVAAEPDRVVRALAVVYPELGLEPDWIDPEERIVGLTEIELRRTLEDRRLSIFLSCGRTVTAAEVADESRVRLGVVTHVSPGDQAGTSVLNTRVEGAAFPMDARERQRRDCVTTGRLEADILERVRLRLGIP